VSSTTASVSNLAPGTTYYFAVAAVGAAGTSGLSNVITVKTPGSPPPPPYWHWGGGAVGPWLLAALLLALLWRLEGTLRPRRVRAAP
jgi:hypothetical protein